MEAISQLDRRTSCSIRPDTEEVLRYLGLKRRSHLPGGPDGNPSAELSGADEGRILERVECCVKELREVCRPQFVSMRVSLDLRDGAGPNHFDLPGETGQACAGHELHLAGQAVRSASLYRNLKGCTQAVLFAATLGIGPDRLIARAAVGHVSDMMIYQAAAAAMIEAWCDEKNEQIRVAAQREGFGCRPRFSPGYGDFSLEFQADILRLLNASRLIGITLTDSLLMAPSKSVTAVIGLCPDNTCGAGTGQRDAQALRCMTCAKTDCAFRRQQSGSV